MTEREERNRVIACARSWLGTPFHINAAIKGIGVDCLRLVWNSFIEAGVIVDPGRDSWPHHDVQWSLHQDRDVLVEYVEQYAAEVTDRWALPADIVLIKRPIDRVNAHAGLVVEWPRVIHVFDSASGVTESNALAVVRRWPETQFRFFDVWSFEK